MTARRTASAGLSQQAQLVVMVRWPAPGRCKSRLAAGIGAARAAAVQRRLTHHTLAVAAATTMVKGRWPWAWARTGSSRRGRVVWVCGSSVRCCGPSGRAPGGW